MRQMWVETACCAMANGGSIGISLYKLKGDAMNLTVTFQNNMLGVSLGFSYNHALFWCQWLSIDENYFLGWSLKMTSTCLEHKTSECQIHCITLYNLLISSSFFT